MVIPYKEMFHYRKYHFGEIFSKFVITRKLEHGKILSRNNGKI